MSNEQLPISPVVNNETAPFWDAANEDRLMVKKCLDTGKYFHPPRTFSPFTGSAQTEWIEASGTGTVYSFSISSRTGEPHCIAYITLTEGPLILSALTDCDFNAVEIGKKVRVKFVPSANGQKIPMFTLA